MLLDELRRALLAYGVDLEALGLAWARTTPSVILVPAFGLRGLPGPARALVALTFGCALLPAAGILGARPAHVVAGWPVMLVGEVLRGLAVAVSTAVPLWAATMTGEIADAARGGGSGGAGASPVVEGSPSPLGVPMSMLASAIWLATGGPARTIDALARPMSEHVLIELSQVLASGVVLAVSLAAPVLVTSLVIEFALALVTRAASPAQVTALLSPLRSFFAVGALALVLDRIARAMAATLH